MGKNPGLITYVFVNITEIQNAVYYTLNAELTMTLTDNWLNNSLCSVEHDICRITTLYDVIKQNDVIASLQTS